MPSIIKEEFIKSVFSIPSKLVYSVDVPEVENFQAQFVYNYYLPDESVQDYSGDLKNIKTPFPKDVINIFGDVLEQDITKISSLKRLPRYVKLSWKKTDVLKTTTERSFGSEEKKYFGVPEFSKADIGKIVRETEFVGSYFSAIQSNNGTLVSAIGSTFTESEDFTKTEFDDQNIVANGVTTKVKNHRNNFPKSVKSVTNTFKESNLQLQASMSAIDYQKSGIELKNKTVDSYLDKLKSTKFYSQINNSFLYPVLLESLTSTHANQKFFQSLIDYSKSVPRTDLSYKLTNEEYQASIPYHTTYQNSVKSSLDDDATFKIVGYIIEKTEIFSDGTINKFTPIRIPSGGSTSYIDLRVRYGSTYFYSIRAVMDVTYNAIDNKNSSTFVRVGSYIASQDSSADVLTVEHVSPPPPADFKIIWDYDRFNQNTVIYDHENNRPFPNTGTRGSLMLAWTMPVNSQRDVKKIQVFRRRSINEPFELIKMYDFNDSISRFDDLENNINLSLISRHDEPVLYYFDDDFYKNSEYIYALATIDAHGLTSNYSEQFKVKFNIFENKIEKELISIAGAPKQYPNMYLERDLFVDTIKTSNKNMMHVYLNPDCFRIKKGDNKSEGVLQIKPFTSKSNIKYCINFINTDVQKSKQLNVNIIKKVT